MFCAYCGTQVPGSAKFCAQCGQAMPLRQPETAPEPTTPAPARRRGTGRGLPSLLAAGLLLGALIGFLMRPSVALIGQLPLMTVVTRGSMLTGIDQLLIPVAQESFNVMLAGAAIGAAAGFGLSRVLTRRAS